MKAVGRRVVYLLVAALLGGVTALVLGATVSLVDGGSFHWAWFDPVLLGPLVTAVVAAAWGVRPLLRRSPAWVCAAGGLLAMVAAAMFGAMFFVVVTIGEERIAAQILRGALEGAIFGPFLCVLLGYVTFPLGVLFAWILRAVLSTERIQTAASAAADSRSA
jgi:hypothetical protein